MKITHHCKQTLLIMLGCIAFVLGLPACQQEGSAEKAGQKIDKAVDNVGKNIEQTTEKAGQKVDAAKKSVEQQAEKTGKQIDQVINKAGNQLENAKESVVDTTAATGEYLDDAAITAKIKAALLNDEFLKATQIEVTTVNGVVKLSGTVDSEQLVGRAIGLANSQEHVKSVENQLMIKANEPSQP